MNAVSPPIRLAIVIPCYNESERIGLLYKGIASFMELWKSPFEVVIVDDGSKDDTYRLLQEHELYKQHSDIISIHRQENTGKGGALRNGILKASGDHILTLDADMASPPSELLRWLKVLNGSFDNNTIYIGSREHKDSIIKKQGDRKAAGNIFNLIVRTLTPLKARDTQCGFKLYPADAAKRYFGDLQTYGWAHDVEVLYKAHLDGKQIVEMPLEWNAIEGSKIRLIRDSINMLMEVLSIVRKTKRNFLKAK